MGHNWSAIEARGSEVYVAVIALGESKKGTEWTSAIRLVIRLHLTTTTVIFLCRISEASKAWWSLTCK